MSADWTTLSIVLPTFNERENIVGLIEQLRELFEERGYRGEVIVVDDDSPDGTGQAVEELASGWKNVRLETRRNERGIGSAHARGYDLSKGDVIITMDVDGSHDVADIPRLLDRLSDGYDVVIGSRYVRGGGTDKPFANRLISLLGGQYARLTLRLGVVDSTNGFRAFRRKVWERIRHHRYSERNVFLIEFLYHARRSRALMTEVPVFFRERTLGESKTPVLQESVKALMLPIRLRLGG
ncbi:MAG: polyprenol monophosphomannose synthase [Candidatus Undinarchaeales archaeon]|jgi:dolichol-phosphate mannosyltransferase|nr:polyprenol monophosphomannose synthase [Candidatus Undinarchaeales archaeon]MDP7493776.1 polyprenol monophosphomannose synthase [Candidatus Undinarchaeales archaeon]